MGCILTDMWGEGVSLFYIPYMENNKRNNIPDIKIHGR
jgi:hypothetical protein